MLACHDGRDECFSMGAGNSRDAAGDAGGKGPGRADQESGGLVHMGDGLARSRRVSEKRFRLHE